MMMKLTETHYEIFLEAHGGHAMEEAVGWSGLPVLDKTSLWVGPFSRGQVYSKVPAYIDFKCYGQK